MGKKLSIQDKFAIMREEMKLYFIERDLEIDMCLTALLCQEHVLMVGDPGTAKSALVRAIRLWIKGARDLEIHCCKDTSRTAAFGPVSLSALKQDKIERNLEGGAASVEFLVLEEVFKAGPAVLDMFIMLMNERIYREGIVTAECPLRFIMGASNEWSPEGCEAALSAFFDRFLLRRAVKPIQTKEGVQKLLWELPDEFEPSEHVTLEELDEAFEEVKALEFDEEAMETLERILDELAAQGIRPGDRRKRKAIKAVKAYAYLCEAATVEREHLEILSHIFWQEPNEQPMKAEKIIGKLANPIGQSVSELLTQAEDIVLKSQPEDATRELKKVLTQLKDLPPHKHRDVAIDKVNKQLKRIYHKAVGALEE